jgi:hypothetical protein
VNAVPLLLFTYLLFLFIIFIRLVQVESDRNDLKVESAALKNNILKKVDFSFFSVFFGATTQSTTRRSI